MLFALEWIYHTYHRVVMLIEGFVADLTLDSAASALTGSALILIPCLMLGLTLCFRGFRHHKLVTGLAGGALFGYLGWQAGVLTGSPFLTVPIVYTLLLCVCGFFLLYILYMLGAFLGSFLLFHMVLAGFFPLRPDLLTGICLLGAILYSALDTKFPLVLSAVTGALFLGLIASAPLGLPAGAALACCLIAGGIAVQLHSRRRYRERLAREEAEQLVKYPYGPGESEKRRLAREQARLTLAGEAVKPQETAPADSGETPDPATAQKEEAIPL